MSKLNTQVFEIIDGKIVEGTLADYMNLVEQTTTPRGVGPVYFVEETQRRIEDTNEWESTDVFGLFKWSGSSKRLVKRFNIKAEAQAALEDTFVYDIDHNSEFQIYYTREAAEQFLRENQADL